MVAVRITLEGVTAATQRLGRMADGAREAGGTAFWVGSGVAYAPFVELGTRRMAGRHMLQRALESVAPTIPGAVAAAIARGQNPTAELRRLAFEVLSRTQAQTPVRSGLLRSSMRVSGRSP